MTIDSTNTNKSDPSVITQEQKEENEEKPVITLEAQVDDLDVSKPESDVVIIKEEEQREDEGAKAVMEQVNEEKQENIEEKQSYEEGESSTNTTDDECDGPKELGLVISALQSTIKENQEKVQPVVTETEEAKKQENEKQVEEEEELHSVGRSSVDDNNSVATSTTSTNVSQEEEKVVVAKEKEEATIPTTFDEIVEDILPPTPGVAPQRQTFDFGGRASEDIGDIDSYSANLIALNKIDMKEIKANTLSPRQQERAG
jgi:hypothetical protein